MTSGRGQMGYDDWLATSKAVWTDDSGEWGLRKYTGYSNTGIVHYCDDSPFGHNTGRLHQGKELCPFCSKEASPEVQALHMLQNPGWYDKT